MKDDTPPRSLLDPPKGEGPHQAMMAVGMAHDMLAQHNWDEFLEHVGRFNDAGAIFDPTAWQRAQNNPNWDAQRKLAEAARQFVREVADVKANLTSGEGED